MDLFKLCLVIPLALAATLAAANSQTATDMRVKQITDSFAAAEADYNRVKDDLDKLIRVKLDISPDLLLLGEQVTLSIEARSTNRPNPELEVIEGCYRKAPKTHIVTLDWKKNESGDGFAATWTWRPPRCGNYLLHWKCDIGGDIPEFWRNFTVVDNSYAVMILNSTSHGTPRPEPDFHELHLPFSGWWEPVLWAKRESAEHFAGPSRWARQFGDDPSMLVFTGSAYIKNDQTTFYDEPDAVQKTVLECLWKFSGMFRFPRQVKSLCTYGIGNGPVRTARALGYDLVGALCADQNWQDGAFKINHYGMPARPYFISRDDFRKPGDGGPNAVVGIQQCERQTMECRHYSCVYAFESGIAYSFDRYQGITRPRIVNDVILSREMDFFQCFVECAGQAETPIFFSCGFEFNGVWPEMAAVNRQFMEYLVRRANDSRIVYTTATAAADFFRRHYANTPESILYLPDVYVGMTSGGKPANYPDTMEIENHLFKAIFVKGETLPRVYYDYTTRWDYPDWGNEDIPRQKTGYIIPNTEDRFRVTPRILDTRPFTVSSNTKEYPNRTVVNIGIIAENAQDNLALAVWDLPREYSKDVSKFELTGARRFVPVRAPYTRNLCGIIIADIKKGKNSISLTVKTKKRSPKHLDLKLSDHIAAKVFERDGGATAYLYSTGDTAEELQLVPHAGQAAKLYPFDSDEPVVVDKPITIKIEPGKCQRLVGTSGFVNNPPELALPLLIIRYGLEQVPAGEIGP